MNSGRHAIALGLVLLAVVGTTKAACPDDCDLDGFTWPVDCNDRNPNVFPGAAEDCNGIDNDCDGVPDDSATCTQGCAAPDARAPGSNVEFGEQSPGAPRLAWDGGSTIVVWRRFFNHDLQMARLGADGQLLTPIGTIPDGTIESSGHWHSLAGSGTSFGVAWTASARLFFTRLDVDAQSVGGDIELYVAGSFGYNPKSPRMVWNGSAYGLLWLAEYEDGWNTRTRLMLTILGDSGERLVADVEITDAADPLRFTTQVGWDIAWTGTEFVVVYVSRPTGRIALRQLSGSGALIGEPVLVGPTALDPTTPGAAWTFTEPRLLRTGDDLALAYRAHSDAFAPSDDQVFLSRLTPAGDLTAGPVVVTPPGRHPNASQLAWTGQEIAVLWGGHSRGEPPINHSHLHLARYDSALTLLGRRTLSLNHQTVGGGSLVWNGSRYLVAWSTGGRIVSSVVACDCDIDADGDGASTCSDCDDADAARGPLLRLCDGLNNDCYHAGFPQGGFEERDVDADGRTECEGDCDDELDEIYPNAPQICGPTMNLRSNNDCNHPRWPLLAGTNEYDDDGDGRPECDTACQDFTALCSPDCDDSNAAVFQLAPQICGDGANNDCFHPTWPSLIGTGELDEDGDGVTGCDGDNCPAVANPGFSDGDADTVGDACDNCPTLASPAQDDIDEDGEGNLCDLNDQYLLIDAAADGSFTWQEDAAFATSNVYRGDASALVCTTVFKLIDDLYWVSTCRPSSGWTQAPGSNPIAARFCGLTAPALADPFVPGAGEVAFYLIAGVTGGGADAGLGIWEDSLDDTGPRISDNPCP